MAPSGPDQPVVSVERERERIIEVLSQHFAHDNLSLEELERRIERAYRAPTVAALKEITRDLATDAVQAAPARPVVAPDAFPAERDRLVFVMSNSKRRGVWHPPRHLDVWCVMSDTYIDLTEAQFQSGVTEIHLHALMAGIKIIVPPGVRVVFQPSAFMADVGDETFDPPSVGSGAPVIRISGPVIMTELKVRVRTREQPED